MNEAIKPTTAPQATDNRREQVLLNGEAAARNELLGLARVACLALERLAAEADADRDRAALEFLSNQLGDAAERLDAIATRSAPTYLCENARLEVQEALAAATREEIRAREYLGQDTGGPALFLATLLKTGARLGAEHAPSPAAG
jgi:hypothetical protein